MIKLAYKDYPLKMSLGACKVFYDDTGLDLQIVFQEYLELYSTCDVTSIRGQLLYFAKAHTREVATKALHAVIFAANDSIPIKEINDATYRVGWTENEKDDDLSEPWPLVMVRTALEINDYIAGNIESKKTDISEGE